MLRYTKKDKDGRYYIESVNVKLESNVFGHTYGEAIDRFAELENADVAPKSEWISIEDKLPEDCVQVFTYNGVTVKLDFYDATFNTWFSEMHEAVIPVTHWMPLPEPPKMKGE